MSVRLFLVCGLPFLAPLAGRSGQVFSDFSTPLPMKAGDTLIVGFLGGWDNWNDDNRAVRKLTMQLRGVPGVHAETVENHRRDLAVRLVREALDADRDGRIAAGERLAARIILYGQSMGGAAVVKLARELNDLAVPVQLSVQVDSWGQDDDVIPPNVRTAVNYYQREPFTWRGQTSIRAEDPSRTEILGSFLRHYPHGSPLNPRPESWRRRTFGGGHARMEADTALWDEIASLIRSALR